MKPYPFASLNHLTVPVAMKHLLVPEGTGRGGAEARDRYSLGSTVTVAATALRGAAPVVDVEPVRLGAAEMAGHELVRLVALDSLGLEAALVRAVGRPVLDVSFGEASPEPCECVHGVRCSSRRVLSIIHRCPSPARARGRRACLSTCGPA